LGANTGSFYLFERGDKQNPPKYRDMITINEGEVSCLKFSSNGNLLAVGTMKGIVLIFEINIDNVKEKPKVILFHFFF